MPIIPAGPAPTTITSHVSVLQSAGIHAANVEHQNNAKRYVKYIIRKRSAIKMKERKGEKVCWWLGLVECSKSHSTSLCWPDMVESSKYGWCQVPRKASSPQKGPKKVNTRWFLLGELRSAVAKDRQDEYESLGKGLCNLVLYAICPRSNFHGRCDQRDDNWGRSECLHNKLLYILEKFEHPFFTKNASLISFL